MKSLLMISYSFPPNVSAGAVRSERFARYLQKFGWAVDVVTIKPKRDTIEDKTGLKALGKDVDVHFTKTLDPWLWLRDKRPRNVFVRAVRSILMRLFSFPDHMLLWVPFAVKSSLRICSQRHMDAIYTTSPPHSTHLAGLLVSRLAKKPWVADFRDPWTLNANRNKSFLENIFLRIEKVIEKSVLRKASIILANTTANQMNLLKAFPFLKEEKVPHLPNGWEEFSEVNREKSKDGPFTIVHAGTFYPRFKPYALLYALAEWKRNRESEEFLPWEEDIKVILLGSNDEVTKRVIGNLKLEDIVEIRPWVAFEEARRIMSQADLLWASLGTGEESSTYIPSKLFEYIAAKRPILGFFPRGEAERLIKETGTGKVFTDESSASIILSIFEAKSSKGIRDPSWFKPNEQVIASHHINNVAFRLSQFLDKIVRSHLFIVSILFPMLSFAEKQLF